jgi:hypothetical protein
MAKASTATTVINLLAPESHWLYNDKRKNGTRRYKLLGSNINQQLADEIVKAMEAEGIDVLANREYICSYHSWGRTGWVFVVNDDTNVSPELSEKARVAYEARVAKKKAERDEAERQYQMTPRDSKLERYFRSAEVAYIKDGVVRKGTVTKCYDGLVYLDDSDTPLSNPELMLIV